MLSIVMPTLNSERYLAAALDSLVKQEFRDFELVVVDGFSSDSTLEIVNQYRDALNIKIFHREACGVPDALNFGFQQTSGSYLMWLNSDDKFAVSSSIEKVIYHFDDGYDFVYGDSVIIDAGGLVQSVNRSYPMTVSLFEKGANLFTGSAIFSRRLWEQFGGFSGEYQTIFEYELFRFSLTHFKSKYVPAIVGCLRHHSNTITSRLWKQIEAESCRMRGRPSFLKKLISTICIYINIIRQPDIVARFKTKFFLRRVYKKTPEIFNRADRRAR